MSGKQVRRIVMAAVYSLTLGFGLLESACSKGPPATSAHPPDQAETPSPTPVTTTAASHAGQDGSPTGSEPVPPPGTPPTPEGPRPSSSPPDGTPTTTTTITRPRQNAPAVIDEILADLPLGHMVYELPEPMEVARSYPVKLLISPEETLSQLKNRLENRGQVGGQQIRVARLMEPRLSAASFEITPEFVQEPVAISSSEPTAWVWSVRPKEAGRQRLRLSIDAILEVDGVERRRNVEVFDKEIEVAVQPRRWVRPVVWGALTVAGLAALAALGWWWRRRRRYGPSAQTANVVTGNGEVFISYARRDIHLVAPLAERLRREGYGVWMDVAGIDGATQWREEIARALDRARAIILMASPRSFSSEFVTRELLLAAEERKPILPVYLEPAEVPAGLRLQLVGLQNLEWQADQEASYAQIRRALERLGIKSAPPSPPN